MIVITLQRQARAIVPRDIVCVDPRAHNYSRAEDAFGFEVY